MVHFPVHETNYLYHIKKVYIKFLLLYDMKPEQTQYSDYKLRRAQRVGVSALQFNLLRLFVWSGNPRALAYLSDENTHVSDYGLTWRPYTHIDDNVLKK